ncbi:MAG: hypothetical protein EXS08_13815 [Planctomycetes bacterium]|nr:hypothetical protein [Planctomycetota bacterium]
MNRFTRCLAALAAIVGLALLSGAWLTQDPSKPQQPDKVQAKEAAAKARAAHLAAFKKALPLLKTPLSEAIALAEKETKGKAHYADVELGKDGKLHLQVGLVIGDEFKSAQVDPETKKVTLAKGGDEDEEGDEEDDDDDDDDDD